MFLRKGNNSDIPMNYATSVNYLNDFMFKLIQTGFFMSYEPNSNQWKIVSHSKEQNSEVHKLFRFFTDHDSEKSNDPQCQDIESVVCCLEYMAPDDILGDIYCMTPLWVKMHCFKTLILALYE